jgi:hypothetical protein
MAEVRSRFAYRLGKGAGWLLAPIALLVSRYSGRIMMAAVMMATALLIHLIQSPTPPVRKSASCMPLNASGEVRGGVMGGDAIMSRDGQTVERYELMDSNNMRQTIYPAQSQAFTCEVEAAVSGP